MTVALLLMIQLTAQTERLSLETIFKSRVFSTKGVYGINSLADGKHFTRLENDTLNIYSYQTGQKNGWMATGNQMVTKSNDTLDLSEFWLSQNEKKILVATATESIYRHSEQSEFYVWDIETKTLKQLSNKGKQRLADFSPDGSMVAFVRDNNLFVTNLTTENELQFTADGLDRNIINGTCDWVYEEEFSFTKAFHWSPDGTKIAFLRFDESKVKEFWLTMYGELYPTQQKYKYPKAGEDNSIVSVHVYDLATGKTTRMNVGENPDQYIPRIAWSNQPGKLAIQRLNRLQNKLELLLADASTGHSDVIYTDENKAWVEITDDLIFIPDTDQFVITSERDGFNHIFLGDTKGNLKQLTQGNWDVVSIKGYDTKRQLVWFDAAINGAMNRDVCHVSTKGKTTTVTKKTGWNTADFSSTFDYFIHTWSDANTPPQVAVADFKGKALRVLETNSALHEKMKKYGLRKRELFSLTTSTGVTLNGWMIKPDGFDAQKRYPVLMYVYGGPGSQTVKNSWDRGQLWYQLMAQEGIVVVSVDNRGTGFRGDEFKKLTYKQLGKYETEDQTEAARWLIKEGIADPQRIGIFGWSYGGYMSSLCMTKGADVFSTGIAVAPVTNWRYYDNIYTERFMRTPQENPSGYDDNSPINHVEKLKGNYLLIHGTADDNVHCQNAFDLFTALVAANRKFDSEFYPNSNHGIYTGKNTTFHLYSRMTDFLFKHLKN